MGTGPTGDWADQGGKLALRAAEGWLFLTPEEGWRAWDKATGQFKIFSSGTWDPIAADLDNLAGVGIGTTADAVNKLSVASDATLLSHDGAGHQVKVNKATDSDTASLLFQSGWTGHAEMGLSGDTSFSIKISDDGLTWSDAFKADATAGTISLGMPVTGEAIQQTETDATPGRLLTVGAGGLLSRVPAIVSGDDYDSAYGFSSTFIGHLSGSNPPLNGPVPHNLAGVGLQAFAGSNNRGAQFFIQTQPDSGSVNARTYARSYNSGVWSDWFELYGQHSVVGTVKESGGAPTGALIERGSSASGEYVRFADGTQICTANVTLTHQSAGEIGLTVTFPAAFANGTKPVVNISLEDAVTTPDWYSIGVVRAASVTHSQSALTVYRISGGTDFAAGDTMEAHYTAIGRWF